MGAAELGAILGTVSMLLLGLLAFIGKDSLSKIRVLEVNAARLDTDVAIIKASRISERVDRLEATMAEIKGDVRHILTLLEEQKTHWHNRRESDN